MIPMDDPEFFDKLILAGAMEFSGVDEDGEMLYNFTAKLPEVSPEMHEKLVNNIYEEVKLLWSLGFIEMNILEDNPAITVSARAMEKDALDDLTPYYRYLLNLIKQASRR